MRALRRGLISFFIAATGTIASSCVLVPDADETPSAPTIKDVVARVKCDLVAAMEAPLTEYPWFQTWTAQVSLNFIVDDQAAVTPAATFTQPLTTESLPLRVANAPRSWNLGLGAGVTTTATRSETITFTMSLREIYDDLSFRRGAARCPTTTSIGLNSNLGLAAWVHDSFAPVDADYLVSGHHKSPKSAGAAPSAPKATTTAMAFVRKLVSQTPKNPTESSEIIAVYGQVGQDLLNISKYEISDPTQDPKVADPTPINLDDPTSVPTCAPLPSGLPKTLTDAASKPPPQDKKVISFVDQKHLSVLVECTIASSRRLISLVASKPGPRSSSDNQLLQWAHAVVDYLLPFELDPPMDVISDQIEFTIVYTGSISPSWTLLHFKGPTTGSSLLSGTKTLTHTLNVVIGPPASVDQVSQLSALQIGTAVNNALRVNGISTGP
jgi:hypothetical protein